ncbi:MAG TPA: VOC family protein [Acidimicrobiia bacterium]|jgi:catechol 2,3-dioxygenase-like lactoylglutathione lyase family enzyme
MIGGLDHVALPMRNTEAMIVFYRALGCSVVERPAVVVVHAGEQMINFHRPDRWTNERFTLRAPGAVPPCGDLCFVWDGGLDALHAAVGALGAAVEEGPVERQGGRGINATSVYLRDPDGNLVELMVYGAEPADGG